MVSGSDLLSSAPWATQEPLSKKRSRSPSADDPVSKIVKTYPVVVSPRSRRLKLCATPSSKKQRGVYAIYNKKTGNTYIGKTGQSFQERLSQHACRANDERQEAPIYEELRKDPTNFRFGIIETSENLSAKERELIEAVPEDRRLNCNRGGGGGSSQSSLKDNLSAASEPQLLETPTKYFPFEKKKNGRVSLPFTPKTAKERRVVYVIKDDKSGKRYVGETGQPLAKRMRQHIYSVNHQSGAPIHEAIRKNPKQFGVGILARNVPLNELGKVETRYIQEKDAIGNGFNLNRGGGGSRIDFERLA